MILPILAYGHPNLRKIAEDIDKDYPALDKLLEDMYETMYASNGVGLAAPQINKSIRLFIIDASPFADEVPELEGYKKVFFNAQIVEESGKEWAFNEGCLSVPKINEDVKRKSKIRIHYYDENWNYREDEFDGIVARIIQHEYDHLEGVLFVDRVSPLRKTMLKGKLTDISRGKVDVDYRMIFPALKKGRR
jgi:peptide deformylase